MLAEFTGRLYASLIPKMEKKNYHHYHYHYIRLMALCPGLPGKARNETNIEKMVDLIQAVSWIL